MGQQHDGHLTTEQLSALLDKQLSPQEQFDCAAHLRTCQQCQNLADDLRQTVALLQALPQPELPRSFVLTAPATVTPISERSIRRDTPAIASVRARSHSSQSYLQRSTRVLSAIAAVVGIIFIISSILANITHGGATSTAAMPSSQPAPVTTAGQAPNAAAPMHTPGGTGGVATPSPSPTSSNAGTPTPNTQFTNERNGSILLLLSMPMGRAIVGLILLILGILGVVYPLLRGGKRRRAGPQ